MNAITHLTLMDFYALAAPFGEASDPHEAPLDGDRPLDARRAMEHLLECPACAALYAAFGAPVDANAQDEEAFCDRTPEIFDLLSDGDADPHAAFPLLLHLERCAICRDTLMPLIQEDPALEARLSELRIQNDCARNAPRILRDARFTIPEFLKELPAAMDGDAQDAYIYKGLLTPDIEYRLTYTPDGVTLRVDRFGDGIPEVLLIREGNTAQDGWTSVTPDALILHFPAGKQVALVHFEALGVVLVTLPYAQVVKQNRPKRGQRR